jgi:hypothetical protein
VRLAEVLDAAGITRDDLRELVRQREEERAAKEQRRLDRELLRLGKQFCEERAEARQTARAVWRARTAAAEADALVEELFAPTPAEEPPLIETEGCAAYRCPNAAALEVAAEFSGRVLRVRYCPTHGAERRAELELSA